MYQTFTSEFIQCMKKVSGRWYLKLSVVLFHAMTLHFSKCRDIVSVHPVVDLTSLAYISQLIKEFVLPLYPVLYVKVGSSSFYLPCVKYLWHDVIIARPKQGCTKKWNVTVYHFRYYISVIFSFNQWMTYM